MWKFNTGQHMETRETVTDLIDCVASVSNYKNKINITPCTCDKHSATEKTYSLCS